MIAEKLIVGWVRGLCIHTHICSLHDQNHDRTFQTARVHMRALCSSYGSLLIRISLLFHLCDVEGANCAWNKI